jgi:DNA-binding transcriptional regulator YdaS (Cro superfamily)
MTLASYMADKGLTDGELAADLGVSDELVRLWRNGIRQISAERAVSVSKITGIPRYQLRPDLWDPPAKTLHTDNNSAKPKANRAHRAGAASDTPTSSSKAA